MSVLSLSGVLRHKFYKDKLGGGTNGPDMPEEKYFDTPDQEQEVTNV